MLVLLSSSARRRYNDDIVRALAHPAGTEFRFRYGEKYLESGLAAQYRCARAANLAGLICHLGTHEDAVPLLAPCRFVTVTSIQKVGSSYVFTLRVGEFVKDLDDAKLRSLMTADELALLPPTKSDAKTPPGRFVFQISETLTPFRAAASEAMTAFEGTTEALRREAKFEMAGLSPSSASWAFTPRSAVRRWSREVGGMNWSPASVIFWTSTATRQKAKTIRLTP